MTYRGWTLNAPAGPEHWPDDLHAKVDESWAVTGPSRMTCRIVTPDGAQRVELPNVDPSDKVTVRGGVPFEVVVTKRRRWFRPWQRKLVYRAEDRP